MKSRIPVLVCLLLSVVCCGGRHSAERKAYASLDTVIRLYEAGADSIDAELLAPALSYFPSRGDAATKGKLWYQWGMINYRRGEYDKAVVSLRLSAEGLGGFRDGSRFLVSGGGGLAARPRVYECPEMGPGGRAAPGMPAGL